jgi:CrcB protein
MRIVLVGIGGMAGSMLRYWLSGVAQGWAPGSRLPAGTIAVNLIGCLVIGILAGVADARGLISADARAFLFAGLLGGFTTFSAFALETTEAARGGMWSTALANVAISVLGGVALVWIGRTAMIQVLR